VDSQISFLQLV